MTSGEDPFEEGQPFLFGAALQKGPVVKSDKMPVLEVSLRCDQCNNLLEYKFQHAGNDIGTEPLRGKVVLEVKQCLRCGCEEVNLVRGD